MYISKTNTVIFAAFVLATSRMQMLKQDTSSANKLHLDSLASNILNNI